MVRGVVERREVLHDLYDRLIHRAQGSGHRAQSGGEQLSVGKLKVKCRE